MLWLTRALPVKADYTSPACYCTPNRTMINLIVEWIQNMRPTCCHDDPFKFKYSNIGPTQVLRILLHILPIQNFESCVLGDGCPKCHVVHPPWEVSSSVVHRWVQQYTPCVLLYRFPPFHVTTDSLSFKYLSPVVILFSQGDHTCRISVHPTLSSLYTRKSSFSTREPGGIEWTSLNARRWAAIRWSEGTSYLPYVWVWSWRRLKTSAEVTSFKKIQCVDDDWDAQ
jgi:hypothetical protein